MITESSAKPEYSVLRCHAVFRLIIAVIRQIIAVTLQQRWTVAIAKSPQLGARFVTACSHE